MEEGLKFRLNTYSKSIKVGFVLFDILFILGSGKDRLYQGLNYDRGDILSSSWYFVKLWKLIQFINKIYLHNFLF